MRRLRCAICSPLAARSSRRSHTDGNAPSARNGSTSNPGNGRVPTNHSGGGIVQPVVRRALWAKPPARSRRSRRRPRSWPRNVTRSASGCRFSPLSLRCLSDVHSFCVFLSHLVIAEAFLEALCIRFVYYTTFVCLVRKHLTVVVPYHCLV